MLDGKFPLMSNKGETVAIFGPSGGGKTVLSPIDRRRPRSLTAATFALTAEASSMSRLSRENSAWRFRISRSIPHLTAFENIASPLRALGQNEVEIKQGVGKVADLLKIDHVLTHLPKALSNGQKQRTSLARSLVRGPKLLLLDDPLRNVDAKLRYEMRVELPRLLKRSEATVLYVTQDYKEAMALGDRIAVLDDAHFAQIDTPARIYRHPTSTKVARLLGDPTINLQPTRLSVDGDGVSVELFGRSFPVKVKPGDVADCLIGIRPEHIKVSMAETESGQPAELDAVTPLNVRSVLLLKTPDGGELLASCSEAEAARLPRGHRKVWLDIAPEHLVAFDAHSGERLATADVEGGAT